jgi:hypothetical protein
MNIRPIGGRGSETFHPIHMIINNMHSFSFKTLREIEQHLKRLLLSEIENKPKFTALWDIAPCSLVEVDRRFRGAYCLLTRQYTGLFKMIHPISNDYILEVYKNRVISDTSTKRTTVEVLSLTL